jgi:hypothetical protein
VAQPIKKVVAVIYHHCGASALVLREREKEVENTARREYTIVCLYAFVLRAVMRRLSCVVCVCVCAKGVSEEK